MQSTSIARWALLIGLAFVFLYFGIEKFLHPTTWMGWMPDWTNGLLGIEQKTWLYVTGVSEILIGVALLVPLFWVYRIAALAAGLHLCLILSQIGWNEIAVRDVGLLLMAVAVWFLPRK